MNNIAILEPIRDPVCHLEVFDHIWMLLKYNRAFYGDEAYMSKLKTPGSFEHDSMLDAWAILDYVITDREG